MCIKPFRLKNLTKKSNWLLYKHIYYLYDPMDSCIITFSDPQDDQPIKRTTDGMMDRNPHMRGGLEEFFAMMSSQPEDFFFQRGDLTEPNEDGSRFYSRLGVAEERSTQYVHGSNAFPWIIEWISGFLEKRGLSFDKLKKIRFKEITKGNVIYTITDERSERMAKEAYILGEFVDTNWKNYYFYWEEERWNRKPLTYFNKIPHELLADWATNWNNMSEQSITSKESAELSDLSEFDTDWHAQRLKENEWYVWSIVLDMVSLIYTRKAGKGGLVVWYDNLSINKDAFSPEQLFDSSCVIETALTEEPRHVALGTSYKWTFSLIHKDKWQLISGSFSLFSSKDWIVIKRR